MRSENWPFGCDRNLGWLKPDYPRVASPGDIRSAQAVWRWKATPTQPEFWHGGCGPLDTRAPSCARMKTRRTEIRVARTGRQGGQREQGLLH
jgi:hypothetical protein